jgi:hypothetical protein
MRSDDRSEAALLHCPGCGGRVPIEGVWSRVDRCPTCGTELMVYGRDLDVECTVRKRLYATLASTSGDAAMAYGKGCCAMDGVGCTSADGCRDFDRAMPGERSWRDDVLKAETDAP